MAEQRGPDATFIKSRPISESEDLKNIRGLWRRTQGKLGKCLERLGTAAASQKECSDSVCLPKPSASPPNGHPQA